MFVMLDAYPMFSLQKNDNYPKLTKIKRESVNS